MEKHYLVFDKYVCRTPLWSFPDYNNTRLFSHPAFHEALFLASPDFYREKRKGIGADDERMKLSLYKYLTRSATRCTPFGLFAGCAVGQVGKETTVVLKDMENYSRVTRLDMNYMCALIQEIESRPEIRRQLKYSTNDSIYQLGGEYRYVEYYYRGVSRVHHLSGVEKSDYLTCILKEAQDGKPYTALASMLVDDEITYDEAAEFIDELIDSQLLKSELEIPVTGKDPLETLLSKLQALEGTAALTECLLVVGKWLNEIDRSSLGDSLELYEHVLEEIQSLKVKFDPKFLFQTDLFKPAVKAEVSERVVDELSDFLVFMNKITPKDMNPRLTAFRKAFYERYEEREMPLLEVLDTELGIGYGDRNTDVPNELFEGIPFGRVLPENEQPGEQSGGHLQKIILNKYLKAVKENMPVVRLTDEDVSAWKTDWKDLPATLYVMCSLLKDEQGKEMVSVHALGGSSGANLLGRFCHLDKGIETLAGEIAEKDQELASDAILAEIVHLPESRAGNILFRPILRKYEIHYLAHSGLPASFQIPLCDLYLSVRNDRIIMRSKKLSKEIIPRLTTAHNYSYNALPVYQFLCDMQTQHLRSNLFLKTSHFFNETGFYPRIMYKNFILSRAKWLVDSEQMKGVSPEEVKNYMDDHHIPRFIVIAEGDNEQFIDFEDPNLMLLFVTMLKKRKKMWIDEFLFRPEQAVVRDQAGRPFCNEFIFSYYKTGNYDKAESDTRK